MIAQYIYKALPYAIFFGIVYSIARIVYIKKKRIQIEIKEEILKAVFWMYLFVLLSQTVFPLWQCGFCEGKFYLQVSTYGNGTINLIPFKTVYSYLTHNAAMSDWGEISKLNLLANLGLFLPLGFLFPLIYPKKEKYTVLVGGLLSLFIEIVQIFVERSSDVDDLLLNIIGTGIGYFIYKIIVKKQG